MEGVVHLLANSFIVYPLTQQILTAEKRFPSVKTRKLLAIAFLAFISFISISVQLVETIQQRNAFRILGVSRIATDGDIRKAYKVKAVELHPDKNRDDPLAEEKFVDLKKAYDELLNSEFRDSYDKWGEVGTQWVEKNTPSFQVFVNGVTRVLIKFAMMFGSTFLMTLMAGETDARAICFSALLVFFSFEAHLRFEGTEFYLPFAKWMAIHQFLDLLTQSFYTLVTGVVAFQNLTYYDANAANVELLKNILIQQSEMQNHLLHLDQSLNRNKAYKAEEENIQNNPNIPRNLRARMKSNALRTQPIREKSTGIPRWIFLIAIYFGINFFLK